MGENSTRQHCKKCHPILQSLYLLKMFGMPLGWNNMCPWKNMKLELIPHPTLENSGWNPKVWPVAFFNWAAQHDESGRVARYHLTWLEWYVVLRLSWQSTRWSTRFQNPRQKAGNDGPLFFDRPFHPQPKWIEMVKSMIWVQVPDFWNIRRTDWQGASSSQNVHFLVIILYMYIIYIYIIYIYLYIIYILCNYLFSRGGPYLSHQWIRSHRPSPQVPIVNILDTKRQGIHRGLGSLGFAESGSPKNKTDTLR